MKLRKLMNNASMGIHEALPTCNSTQKLINRDGPCDFIGYLLTKEELEQLFEDACNTVAWDYDCTVRDVTFEEWLKEQEKEGE